MTGTPELEDLRVDPAAPRRLPPDTVGLLEGICTTRAIRRYRNEPVPASALRDMLFAATRAPSGSNRQPFRFLVLTDGPKAKAAKALIAQAAAGRGAPALDRPLRRGVRRRTRLPQGGHGSHDAELRRPSGRCTGARLGLPRPPPCALLGGGASIYPACQNLLLAARALGYGGVMTSWHLFVEAELRTLLGVPDNVFMAAAITIGRPMGHHGPVRRRPLNELVFLDEWDVPPRSPTIPRYPLHRRRTARWLTVGRDDAHRRAVHRPRRGRPCARGMACRMALVDPVVLALPRGGVPSTTSSRRARRPVGRDRRAQVGCSLPAGTGHGCHRRGFGAGARG